MRGERPFVFTNLKNGAGMSTVLDWLRGDLQQVAST
jgi:Ni2+-binding GTPase involved in maturation of urease and hydrogenase